MKSKTLVHYSNLIIVVIIFTGLLNGCSTASNTTVDATEEITSNTKIDRTEALTSAYNEISNELIFGNEGRGDYLGLYMNHLVYSTDNEELDEYNYYMLNMETLERSFLGVIKNPYVCNMSTGFYDGSIYMYMAHVENNNETVMSLYEFDLINKQIKNIDSCESAHNLSYVTAIENEVFTTKGEITGDVYLSYVDKIDAEGLKEKERVIEHNASEQFVLNLDTYDNELYVLISTIDGFKMAVYSNEGVKKREFEATDAFLNFTQFYISKFYVCGEYVFIRNFSSEGMVCKIVGDKLVPVVLSELMMDISTVLDSVERNQMILYSRREKSIWVLDTDKEELHTIRPFEDISYEFVTYITDNDNNELFIMLRNEDNELLKFHINITINDSTKVADFKEGIDVYEISDNR